jgi:thiol-disulfide isomerase/thioredoxin
MAQGLPLFLLAMALAADETQESRDVVVTLAPGLPGEGGKLGYSSPRKLEIEATAPRFIMEIPKFTDPAPLFFRLSLGETKGIPYYGALDRQKDQPYNLLYLDRDRDLDLTNDGPPVRANIRSLATSEAKLVEFLDLQLTLPYVVEGKELTEKYACVLFFLAEKPEEAPKAILVERDGWREGSVPLAGEDHAIALVDDDSDGQFSTGDSWVMRPATTSKGEMLDTDATRSMLFPSWTKDQKWMVEVKAVDPAGRTATVRISAAKETEMDYFLRVAEQRQTPEEKELKLDPLRPKASAEDKIDWITNQDAEYALDIANAANVKKPVLLEFWSPNCPWCARMEQYTFRDRETVALAKRFVCSKIGFNKGTDDAKKYRVEGTPTYVIVGLDGAEVARHSGFLRPTDFAKWLKGALR